MFNIEAPKLKEIAEMPTVIGDKLHQSLTRSHHLLLYILRMVERGDSKETIWDVYAFLSDKETEIND